MVLAALAQLDALADETFHSDGFGRMRLSGKATFQSTRHDDRTRPAHRAHNGRQSTTLRRGCRRKLASPYTRKMPAAFAWRCASHGATSVLNVRFLPGGRRWDGGRAG